MLYRYDITVRRWQVSHLKALGYTPKKTFSKAFEQNPTRVNKWFDKEYLAIKELEAKENATIYYEDEGGMRSDHQAGKSYSPKEQSPVINRTGQRFSLNKHISAISDKGHVEFIILDGTFNGKAFIEFSNANEQLQTAKTFSCCK